MIGEIGENSKIVIIKEAVRIKVPVDVLLVAEVKRENSGKTVVIPAHWHNAFAVGKVVVNRNYYGVTKDDVGRRMTVTVQVFEKTVAGGKKYTAIDFFKGNGTRPTFELKIVDIMDTVGISVPINGTDKFISFKLL